MNTLWVRLSAREKALGLAVVTMLAAGLAYLLFSSATQHLERQDAMIDHYEQQLINYSRHMERRSRVDAAFGQIAAQHSSEWSGEEIYDRLGSEIYRLARQDPGDPGSPGSGPDIVPIPQLPPGELQSNPEGYRSYTVEFKTGETSIQHIAAFLRRLEESPQALRIEALDIRRPPDQLEAGQATIRVNRTVVDGVKEAVEPPSLPDDSPFDRLPSMVASTTADYATNGSFENFDGGTLQGWVAENCGLSAATEFVTDGSASLRVQPSGGGAFLAQPVELIGGRSYTMTIDLKSTAPLAIAVVDRDDNRTYDGVVNVTADGKLRSYTVAFTVDGTGARSLLAPRIEFRGSDGAAVIDRVRIRPFAGAK